MEHTTMAIVPVHCEDQEDAVHLRLLEEMAKNRILGMQLDSANAIIRMRAVQKEARRRVRMAALRLLGWFGFGVAWGALAMACWFLAPRWTCIAPAVLMAWAWWKAGGEV